MKKAIPKKAIRKAIVIAAAVILAVIIVVGLVMVIKHFKNKSTTTANGTNYATEESLKTLKAEAEKLSKASEVFYTLDDYKDYEYPDGKVITVEVNDYGKLVVLGNEFQTDALNDLIEYSKVNVGADIGITDVVYSIRFDKDNVIETAVGKENDPDSILSSTTETTESKIKVKSVDDDTFKGYADEILSILKSYVSSNKITLSGCEILIYTDEEGYLRTSFTGMGITYDQLDEFNEMTEESAGVGSFIGYAKYDYKITADNDKIEMTKYNPGEE